MVISSNDLRPGVTIKINAQIFSVIEFLHVKPGKGSAFVRTKLKNLKNGNTIEKTFRAGERLEDARIEKKNFQYSYQTGENLVVIDLETFEQLELTIKQIGKEKVKFLKEEMEVTVVTCDQELISVEIPTFVILEVSETPPGVKGDTAANNNKPAQLETGANIQVPFFVNVGDKVKVDTRTGTYLERAN